ncbi:MAG: hypothetical protein D6696_15555, partial [Acidobacteria bacterium]
MMLQSLIALAEREGLMDDPDFVWQPVGYLVRVGEGGKLLGISSTYAEIPDPKGRRKPRRQAKLLRVPREPTRTSGDRANFLIDKAEYVFGIDPAGKRPAKKLANRFRLFRERVAECARATRDEGVEAVASFLDDLAAGRQQVELPEECTANDLFAFVYDLETLPINQRPAVRAYWQAQRLPTVHDPECERTCLVTGERTLPAELHQ